MERNLLILNKCFLAEQQGLHFIIILQKTHFMSFSMLPSSIVFQNVSLNSKSHNNTNKLTNQGSNSSVFCLFVFSVESCDFEQKEIKVVSGKTKRSYSSTKSLSLVCVCFFPP